MRLNTGIIDAENSALPSKEQITFHNILHQKTVFFIIIISHDLTGFLNKYMQPW